jgi:hypothetical protein
LAFLLAGKAVIASDAKQSSHGLALDCFVGFASSQ